LQYLYFYKKEKKKRKEKTVLHGFGLTHNEAGPTATHSDLKILHYEP
jgi:hypothetical protein